MGNLTKKTMVRAFKELDPFSKNKPDYVLNIERNSTPFKVIEFGIYELQLYRSSSQWQVISVIYQDHMYVSHRRTTGGGYCKESHSTELFWRDIGYHPKENSYLHDTINYKYHVGGNFYRVPVADIRKNKRRS